MRRSNSIRLGSSIPRSVGRQGRPAVLVATAGLLLVATPVIGWQAAVVVMIGAVCLAAVDGVDRLVMLTLFLAWFAVVQSTLMRFTVFDQFLMLLNQKIGPIDLLVRMDLWGPRYVIAYPAVLIADRWDVSLDDAFGYFMAAVLAVQAFVLTKTVEKAVAGQRSLKLAKLAIAAVFALWIFGLGRFMNGRLAPAHLGMALVLYAQVRSSVAGRVGPIGWLLQTLGLLLSMMTSGTMMVAFFQIALMPVIGPRVAIGARQRLRLILPTILILLAALPIIRVGVDKNLTFWAGSGQVLETMLQHGWGELLQSQPLLLVVVVGTGWLYAFAIGRVWRRHPQLRPLLLNVPLAALCGLYGYSTLTMGLPALAILSVTGVMAVLAFRKPGAVRTLRVNRLVAARGRVPTTLPDASRLTYD